VVTRESKVGAPRASAPLKAADVPVTRAMLGGVRTELLQRIDQAREEAKEGTQKLDAKIDGVKAELKADIHKVKTELHEVKADLHNVKGAVHGMQAQMARIELLVEEQNARNKIVLDGIAALLSRQDQVEQRMAQVEDTIRKIASA
jgi:chromosome segregation ATPase